MRYPDFTQEDLDEWVAHGDKPNRAARCVLHLLYLILFTLVSFHKHFYGKDSI